MEKRGDLLYNSLGDFMNEALHNGCTILRQLHDAGYEAFFVGGAVRDYLLGIQSGDVDITTNAHPEEVQRLFERTILTGKAFGTITVLHGGYAYEVTTYRSETQYDNHRHPSQIQFADDVRDDLSRRDFTINQLLMDEKGTIHDHHGGQDDLHRGIIRTIGDPSARFNEDALRMLRAFRFMAVLGFSLESSAADAIAQTHEVLRHVSVERIHAELFKLFDAHHKPRAIKAMVQSGIHTTLGLSRTLTALQSVQSPYDSTEAFALGMRAGEVDQERFRLSKQFTRTITAVSDAYERARARGWTPKIVFDYGLQIAEHANRLNVMLGGRDESKTLKDIDAALKIRDSKELAIDGRAIKALRPKKKSHIARTLDALNEAVLNGEVANEKTALTKRAKTILNTLKGE